jgi:[ribosomal protein S18]-alanine N-acetyltransferase
MTVPGIRIADFCAADIDAVIVLERQTSGAPHWQRADYEMLSSFAGALRRRGVVARGASGVAGFAIANLLTVNCETEAELESIVVEAGARRKGLGEALIKALLTRLEREGVSRLRLEVRSSNIAAIALYNACGFRRAGLRKRYYRDPEEDAVQMELRFPLRP